MYKLPIYTAIICCIAAPIQCTTHASQSESHATAEVIRMDSWKQTQEMASTAKVSLAEAFAIAKKEIWDRRGSHAHFHHVFSKDGRYFFLAAFDMDKIHGVKPALRELGVYVDSETGQAEYVHSARKFPPPDAKSEYFKNPLNEQLRLLESQYNNEKSDSAAEAIPEQKVSTGNTARNIREIAKGKHGALAVALNDLADREEKEDSDGLECHVHRIRHYKHGEASALYVLKNGREETSHTQLPACIGIYLSPVELILGGEIEYFYDAQTGELLGYNIWE